VKILTVFISDRTCKRSPNSAPIV